MHGVYALSGVFPLFLTSVAICKGCQGNDQIHLKTWPQERTAYLFFLFQHPIYLKFITQFDEIRLHREPNFTVQKRTPLIPPTPAQPCVCSSAFNDWNYLKTAYRLLHMPYIFSWGKKSFLVKSTERLSLPQRQAWEKLRSVSKRKFSGSLESM